MRKGALLVIVVAVTLGFHPATEAAADMAVVAATLETLTGQEVPVFPEARQLIIKESGWFTVKEVSFVVAEEAAPRLAELQIGDRVEVGEEHMQWIKEPCEGPSPGIQRCPPTVTAPYEWRQEGVRGLATWTCTPKGNPLTSHGTLRPVSEETRP